MTRTRARALALALVAALGIGVVTAIAITAHSTPAVATSPQAVAFDGSQVPVAEWAQAVAEPSIVVLDVRTPEEYTAGHIAGAINVDVSANTFASDVGALDPTASYAVYCHSGNRSQAAIEIMTDLGFTHLLGLEGGIAAWTAAGKPIVTS